MSESFQKNNNIRLSRDKNIFSLKGFNLDTFICQDLLEIVRFYQVDRPVI